MNIYTFYLSNSLLWLCLAWTMSHNKECFFFPSALRPCYLWIDKLNMSFVMFLIFCFHFHFSVSLSLPSSPLFLHLLVCGSVVFMRYQEIDRYMNCSIEIELHDSRLHEHYHCIFIAVNFLFSHVCLTLSKFLKFLWLEQDWSIRNFVPFYTTLHNFLYF